MKVLQSMSLKRNLLNFDLSKDFFPHCCVLSDVLREATGHPAMVKLSQQREETSGVGINTGSHRADTGGSHTHINARFTDAHTFGICWDTRALEGVCQPRVSCPIRALSPSIRAFQEYQGFYQLTHTQGQHLQMRTHQG